MDFVAGSFLRFTLRKRPLFEKSGAKTFVNLGQWR
jgi:hypothetical protein